VERGLGAWQLGCFEISLGDGDGGRIDVRSNYLSDPTGQGRFDELQTGTAERIPDDFFILTASDTHQASRERRVRGGIDGVGTVIKTRVWRDARAQFDQGAAFVEVDIDRPRGFAGVVQDARIQLEGLLGNLGDGVIMITLRYHAEAIAGRALRDGQHQLFRKRRSDGLRQYLKRLS